MRYFWLMLALGSGLACGGSSDAEDSPAVCTDVEPCGGDLVGRWLVETTCPNQEFLKQTFEVGLPDECGGSFRSIEVHGIDFTLEFTAGGTWTASGDAQTRFQYFYSQPCLSALLVSSPASAGGCSELQARGGEASGNSCRFVDDGCECEQNMIVTQASTTFAYTLESNSIVSEGSSSPYCVSGDRLQYGDPEVGLNVATRLD